MVKPLVKHQEKEKQQQEYVLLSLGQLVQSDFQKSIDAFTEVRREQNSLLAGLFVKIKLLIDTLFTHVIKNYKSGKLDDDTFLKKITSKLNLKDQASSKEKVKTAWNAMTTISEPQIEEIRKLATLQQEHGTHLIIVGHTNPLHHQHIMEQLEKANIQLDPTRTTFSLSHEKKEHNFKKLAAAGIRDAGVTPQDTITSLHRTIKNNKDLPPCSLNYTPCHKGQAITPTIELNFNYKPTKATPKPETPTPSEPETKAPGKFTSKTLQKTQHEEAPQKR